MPSEDDKVGGDAPPNEGPNDTTPPVSPETDAVRENAPAGPTPKARTVRQSRPWEALERLDRQWVDTTPIENQPGPISALALTTSHDPEGWDYLSAMTGALPREVVAACEAWLEAQLAADATALGRSRRPRVELVPSGRLWYVVRSVADFILVVDGPGFLTPIAAAIAASRRYEAELRRGLEPGPLPHSDEATHDSEHGSRSRPAESAGAAQEDGPDSGDNAASDGDSASPDVMGG